ncbi:MAG: ATP-dependent DNA helicase RecG [Actinobacteria bacterium]|nr:ATP-dependent DNA helicase RecG [Actinomycetota bacterium]
MTIQAKLSSYLGDKTARAFEKQLGIVTVADLLSHYPRRYSKRGELTPLASLPVGEVVTVVGEVVGTNIRHIRGRSGSILEVSLTDGSDKITLAFFNQAWRQKDLHTGVRGLFSGKIGSFSGKLQLAHPDYELFEELDQSKAKAWADLPIPIYPATSSLTTWKIQKSIQIVLDTLPELEEYLPEGLIEEESLVGLDQAIRRIHQPQIEKDWQSARYSLKFREALLLQLQLAERRAEASQVQALDLKPGNLVGSFDKLLPFEFTSGQIQVNCEIEADLASGHPMHRLIQGEVGSGKTVVALRAMLTAIDSGHQAALLAPTEVLASQHFASIQKTLGPELCERVGLRLLTGQMSSPDKKRALLDVASGKAGLVVGTHALISAQVEFADLALVVIDEQHRFGVNQREALRAKAKLAPHTLVMTATPIPRTMAITVFGDLEISTLTELPAGRQPISSHVVNVNEPKLVSRVWQRVAEEISAGRQAFVVCPRIEPGTLEEGETQELELAEQIAPAAAIEVFEALKLNASLDGVRIGLLHGQLDSETKDQTMQAFSAGEIDVLVSTTVIEVGVNVPNATAMVILDADRFGISQLHQLRGRVGRGNHAGICLMLTGAEFAMQRLEAVASTLDGFKLSEIDLELRGEGDVLGANQSGGRSQLKLLRVTRDAELIEQTRTIAQDLLRTGLDEKLKRVLKEIDAQALARG